MWVWALGTEIGDFNIGGEIPCGDWGRVWGQILGIFGTEIGKVTIVVG